MFAQWHSRVIFELGLESRRRCPILCEIDDRLGEQGSISYYFFQIILNLGFSGWSFNRFIVANWSEMLQQSRFPRVIDNFLIDA